MNSSMTRLAPQHAYAPTCCEAAGTLLTTARSLELADFLTPREQLAELPEDTSVHLEYGDQVIVEDL